MLNTHIETEPVDELKKLIDSFVIKEEAYQSEIAILKEQIRSLQDRLFGRKSEKRPSDDGQPSLFESPEEAVMPVDTPEEESAITVEAHKRKKRGRQPIPENLPRIDKLHDLSDAEKQCPCGCTKICIGKETSEQLDIIPAQIRVILHIRLKYACKVCEGVDDDGPTVTIARMPDIDETPVQVLNEPDKSNQSKSYMWIFRGGTAQAPAVIFEYHPSREGEVAAAFIKGYQGVIQTDGYKGYEFIDTIREILLMGCWAHVRRKFVAVEKASGKPADPAKPGITGQALKHIRKLYDLQRQDKERGLTADELVKERQEKSAPVMADLKKLLDTSVCHVPPKTLLGKAITYALNQWHRLIVYLETPHVTLDNNLVENAIRPFAIGRKNWLFSGSPEGAAASAAIYSLIETAKANGLEPYWYLRYLLKNLPEAMTDDDFKALLPQYIDRSLLDGPTVIS
ncbi:MAG: IS66 family transposase [Desulfamplus sp.]|nr:IS66 family transposase [Desulfamplus sp.]